MPKPKPSPTTPLGPVQFIDGRGLELINFIDRYNTPCSLQQSSLLDPSIWLGVDRQDGPYMHLDLKQVKALIAVLETWAKCGSFTEDK